MSRDREEPRAGRRGLVAWTLYDWANSAFPTVIATFVFSAYYAKAVAVDEVAGTSEWGYAMSLSGLLIAVLGPVMGAMADHTGRRKPWVAAFTGLCVAATAMLWFAEPDPAFAFWALFWVVVANVAFEMSMVFYNAMLPELVPARMVGRLSGWGWGVGYAGGIGCLTLALFLFVRPDPSPFGLDREAAEHIRATTLLVGLWFGLFSLPLFWLTPDAPSRGLGALRAARQGLAALAATLKRVRDWAHILRFLIARMIYTDGLNTLFAFGGIYAAGTFGLDFDEIIVFAIAINVTAGLGAALFAWVDDRIGPKRTVLISLVALIGLGGMLCVAEGKTLFWVFGLPLGIFVGPAQAASRSYMAHLAPAHLRAEMFGLYAFSGKATAFVGPALLALTAGATGSQRWAMATILIFFAVGGLGLLTVPDVRRRGPSA